MPPAVPTQRIPSAEMVENARWFRLANGSKKEESGGASRQDWPQLSDRFKPPPKLVIQMVESTKEISKVIF